MRKHNVIIFAALVLVGLASCEMREEIKGNKSVKDTGVLELSVQAKAPVSMQTKAGEETGADVSTNGFPVRVMARMRITRRRSAIMSWGKTCPSRLPCLWVTIA